MNDDDTYGRPQQHFARIAGMNRAVTYGLTAAVVLLSVGVIGAGGLALYEIRTASSRIERYVVYLDDKNLPVNVTHMSSVDTMIDGAFIDFAQRWVRNLRARPLDQGTLIHQRGEVIRATDAKVFQQLQASMAEADKVLSSNTAVDVLQVNANLVERRDENTAIVLVRWTEQVRAAVAKPAEWTATLTLSYVRPTQTRELQRNPLGIYVIAFQPTKEAV